MGASVFVRWVLNVGVVDKCRHPAYTVLCTLLAGAKCSEYSSTDSWLQLYI